MHAKKITQRAVKPDNVIVEEQPQGLIADFRTSKYHGLGSMETFAGTGICMAPKFWKRRLRYTHKMDMFSLGLTGLLGAMFHPVGPQRRRELDLVFPINPASSFRTWHVRRISSAPY